MNMKTVELLHGCIMAAGLRLARRFNDSTIQRFNDF